MSHMYVGLSVHSSYAQVSLSDSLSNKDKQGAYLLPTRSYIIEVCQAKDARACVMSPEPAIYIGDARELTSNNGR